ncbi:MAG: class IV adenylate cyclase [Methanimicrococcus sp.]|nr:class IV adenylate cyclase [Methanimicrococcus sp.]
MYEVEVKVKVPHAKMKEDLIKKGAVFSGTEKQSDTYFNSPLRDFSKTDEALRIRSVNGAGEMTYKGKKIDTVSKTRPEYNSPVNEDEMKEILAALGFFVSGAVNKTREIYLWEDFVVGFDTVEGLGEFIEVERNIGEETGPKEIQNEIDRVFDFLSGYGITRKESITMSYLEMVAAAKTK